MFGAEPVPANDPEAAAQEEIPPPGPVPAPPAAPAPAAPAAAAAEVSPAAAQEQQQALVPAGPAAPQASDDAMQIVPASSSDALARGSPQKRDIPDDSYRSPGQQGSKQRTDAGTELMPAAVPMVMDTQAASSSDRERPQAASPADSTRVRTIGGLAVNVASFCVVAALSAVLNKPVYGTMSGELLDPEMVIAGRRRERDLMEKFEVFERFPAEQARGKE